ncbi:MAG: CaiB/BaiF CoA transferase family protein [Actinomycetota bacterium]
MRSGVNGPLHGVRIVELAGLGPGPFAGMVLADLGAEVIRVDRPDRDLIVPDPDRPDLGPSRRNPWDVLNRTRPAIRIDLGLQEGAALVRDLMERADVVIEGFRPGVAERLGLGPGEICERNPRLVYGRVTGWGRDGPLADRGGHDLNYLALAGVLSHVGRLGEPPTPPLNLVADFGGGGMLLAVGVLAALVERSVSGLGQVVDAAMVDGSALLMAPLFGAWASGFWSPERGTNLLDSGAPFYDCYRCGDGGWMAVAAIEPKFFAELVRGTGLDSRWLELQHDRSVWPDLRNELSDRFATRTRDAWTEVFSGMDACVTPVLDMGEAVEHAHAVERKAFVDVDGVAQPAPAPRFDRTPSGLVEPACSGDDPTEVLGAWGVDAPRVRTLLEDRVLG